MKKQILSASLAFSMVFGVYPSTIFADSSSATFVLIKNRNDITKTSDRFHDENSSKEGSSSSSSGTDVVETPEHKEAHAAKMAIKDTSLNIIDRIKSTNFNKVTENSYAGTAALSPAEIQTILDNTEIFQKNLDTGDEQTAEMNQDSDPGDYSKFVGFDNYATDDGNKYQSPNTLNAGQRQRAYQKIFKDEKVKEVPTGKNGLISNEGGKVAIKSNPTGAFDPPTSTRKTNIAGDIMNPPTNDFENWLDRYNALRNMQQVMNQQYQTVPGDTTKIDGKKGKNNKGNKNGKGQENVGIQNGNLLNGKTGPGGNNMALIDSANVAYIETYTMEAVNTSYFKIEDYTSNKKKYKVKGPSGKTVADGVIDGTELTIKGLTKPGTYKVSWSQLATITKGVSVAYVKRQYLILLPTNTLLYFNETEADSPGAVIDKTKEQKWLYVGVQDYTVPDPSKSPTYDPGENLIERVE